MNHHPEMQDDSHGDMALNPATREEREVARRRREAERKLAEHYEQAEHGAHGGSHEHDASEHSVPEHESSSAEEAGDKDDPDS
jgi:hypothetical protein